MGYFQVWNSFNSVNVLNTALTSIDVHSLAFVAGHIGVYFNLALTSLSLPALTYVGLYVFIYYNNALTACSMPALTYVAWYFKVNSNSNLAAFAAPALVKIANKGLNTWTVNLCSNAASLSYSAAISHAAALNACWLPPCSTLATCK